MQTLLQRDCIDALAQRSAEDVVFLASLKMPRLSNQWGGPSENKVEQYNPRKTAVVAREALEFARLLQSRGAELIFEAPKPVFRSPPYRCSDWFNRSNPVCKGGFVIRRSELAPAMDKTLVPMHVIAAGQSNVHVWDPFPALCPRETCDAFRGNRPLFFDGDHLSGFANELLYPEFRKATDLVFKKTTNVQTGRLQTSAATSRMGRKQT